MEDSLNICDEDMLSSEGESTNESSDSELDNVIVNTIWSEQMAGYRP